MISETAHISPDGTLQFLVIRTPDGDITMGFSDYPWHTHGDVQAAVRNSSESPEAAAERFVDELLSNKLVIAISIVAGTIRDIWIADDPEANRKWCQDGETIEFRLWDGTKVDV